MSDILKRKMFQEKGLKADSGIMQGFDSEEEPSEDEMMEEVSTRKPSSPEILMNNLRGDMRSVDARYQELAEMVGEEAAMDTPPEVLAMLQAQLAQPAAGIGALPPGQGMSPPPSMPAGAPPMPAPQGAMPMGQGAMPTPQGFAMGGIVRGYEDGGEIEPVVSRVLSEQEKEQAAIAAAGTNPTYEYNGKRKTNPSFLATFRGVGNTAPTNVPVDYNQLVTNAYQNVGRYATGNNPIDQAGYNYWVNQLQTNAINPTQFNRAFLNEHIANANRNYRPEVASPIYGNVTTYGSPRMMAEGGIASLQSGAIYKPGVNYEGQDIETGPAFTKGVAHAGRNGDTVLAHITPGQASLLKQQGGSGSVNPKTGLLEFFKEDEESSDSESSIPVSGGMYSPEQITQAREYLNKVLNAQPSAIPGLEETIKTKEPIYAKLLGGGDEQKKLTEARILFDIAQRGLAFASGTDDQGRPIQGGSAVSRLAGAFKGLPGTIAQETKGMEDVNRAARLAALQSSEKEIEAIRAANIKQEETRRKVFGDILKNSGSAGFGNSLTGRLMSVFTTMTPAYAAGQTTPDQDRVFEASVVQYTQPIETKDERGNITVRKPELPDFVKQGIAARRNLPKTKPIASSATSRADVTDVSAANVASDKPVTATAAQGPAVDQAGVGNTLWGLAPNYAGIVPNVVATATKVGGAFIPGVGELGKDQQYAVQRADTEKGRFISALAVNPRFPVKEMERIEKEISIGANYLDSAASVRTRMIAVDDYLAKEQIKEEKASVDKNLPVTEQNNARTAANDIKNFRKVLGVPVRVYSLEEASKLPSGTTFLWKGIEPRTRK